MAMQIYLDNYNNACYPGQTLSGRVECRLSEAKNIRALRIKFKGKAETNWAESETYYDEFFKEERTRDINYSGQQIYFEQEYTLVGGIQEFTLEAGTHTYPFSYILPHQLPSSFDDGSGKVSYTIKTTLDCPWRFDDDAKVIINLISPLDLNYVPRIQEPVEISVDKTMCSCWCNDSGALTFTMSLPVTGYVPGQELRIGAYVENMTNVSAEKVKFQIYQTKEYIAHSPSTNSKSYQSVIAFCTVGGIGAHSEKSWTSVVPIPTDKFFPNMIPCSIINIAYHLEAEITVPCPHTNLSTTLPLMIGDVPLTQADTSFPLGPPQAIDSPYPNATAPPADGPPSLSSPSAPYPTEGNLPYPPGGKGDAPYLPAVAPYPPTGAGWSLEQPSKGQDSSVPPSYEEAQQLLNKDSNPM